MSSRNRLLATLAPADLEVLGDALQTVELTFKDSLQDPDQTPPHVYFPLSGVVSVVNEPDPGTIVEVATIGREGMVGLPVVLGADTMPNRAFVQVPGEAVRIETEAFIHFLDGHAAFRALLMRYTAALLNQVAQNASCNRMHEVQERCARWLLQTHDRADGDSFPLTQEFLAQMLGVHRPTVSIAAGILQKAGLISYIRGVITVVDRRGLEEATCDCYRFIAREYDRLLGARG
jgi:CRP-like cAMP-binding protein